MISPLCRCRLKPINIHKLGITVGIKEEKLFFPMKMTGNTLLKTNISPNKGLLNMIFLFSTWDLLLPWFYQPQELSMNAAKSPESRNCPKICLSCFRSCRCIMKHIYEYRIIFIYIHTYRISDYTVTHMFIVIRYTHNYIICNMYMYQIYVYMFMH